MACPPQTLDELIVEDLGTGYEIRTRIAHHEGCVVRGVGRRCGCDPIVTQDYHFPRITRF